jgi:hypothetical protein
MDCNLKLYMLLTDTINGIKIERIFWTWVGFRYRKRDLIFLGFFRKKLKIQKNNFLTSRYFRTFFNRIKLKNNKLLDCEWKFIEHLYWINEDWILNIKEKFSNVIDSSLIYFFIFFSVVLRKETYANLLINYFNWLVNLKICLKFVKINFNFLAFYEFKSIFKVKSQNKQIFKFKSKSI